MWSWPGFIWNRVEEAVFVLKPCRFSVLVVLIGGFILIGQDQAQEMLIALDEGPPTLAGFWEWGWFYIAALIWALNSWYWARVIVSFRMREFTDPGGGGEDIEVRRQRVERFRHHVPRFLGAAAFLAVAAACARAGGFFSWINGEGGLVTGLLFHALGAVVAAGVFYQWARKRRKWVPRLQRLLRRFGLTGIATLIDIHDEPKSGLLHWRELSNPTLWIYCGELLLWLILLIWAAWWPVSAGHTVGATSLLFLAFALWVPTGTGLVYVARKYDVPLVGAVIMVALGFSLWNDNHAVRTLAGNLAARPGIDIAFEAWKTLETSELKTGKRLVIVATAGGGSRAAYWTATVLGRIRDAIGPNFDRQLFAISGVSGGALGGTIYMALVSEARDKNPTLNCTDRDIDENEIKVTGFAGCGQAVAAHDFLGPVVASLMFPDMLQRFWPLPGGWGGWPDRAAALEMTFEDAWTESGPGGANRLRDSFMNLWPNNPKRPLPALILNGTSVVGGNRIITSNIAIGRKHFATAIDFFEEWPRPIALSTAVNNAARFPFVEPAGTLNPQSPKKRKDRIVDGGYFENFGAVTARELLDALIRVDTDHGTKPRSFVPIIIQISADPEFAGAEGPDGCPRLRKPERRKTQAEREPGELASEVSAPLVTIFGTRGARGAQAAAALKQRTEQLAGRYFHFRLCRKSGERPPPLGWALSWQSKSRVADQWDKEPDNNPNWQAWKQLCPELGGGSKCPSP